MNEGGVCEVMLCYRSHLSSIHQIYTNLASNLRVIFLDNQTTISEYLPDMSDITGFISSHSLHLCFTVIYPIVENTHVHVDAIALFHIIHKFRKFYLESFFTWSPEQYSYGNII